MARKRASAGRNLLFGAAGALMGVYAMDSYFRVLKRLSRGGEAGGNEEVAEDGSDADESGHALDDISIAGIKARDKESATTALGRLAYEMVARREPSDTTRRKLSTGVHWGYGIAVGALYGLLRGDERSLLDVPGGLGYGAALWLFGDELAVPLLGLAKGPTAYPVSVHAQALGAHLVYGAATSATTNALHRVV